MAKRFLVWNSTGLDASRKLLLDGYVKDHKVDVVILIEGGNGASYTGPDGKVVNLKALSEKREGCGPLRLEDINPTEAAIKGQLGSPIVAGVGGVGGYKYYAIGGVPDDGFLDDDGYVDYENRESDVREWILKPLADRVSADRPANSKATEDDSGERGAKRPARSARSAKFDDEIAIVKARSNFLGHRRPKTLRVDGITVYIWHAPLGGACTPHDATMERIPGDASGGPDAKYHNALFKRHIENLGAREMLVGDLNIDATAVQAVYGVNPAVSSADKWCHVVAGGALTISDVVVVPHVRATMADHAPIIFTAGAS
jgi:hypothetical protein